MKRRVLVVIPAHNEASTVGAVISDVRQEIKGAEVLVINDCSTDQTLEKVTGGGDIKCITNIFNLGYAYSVQAGIKYAKKYNFDYVIQMDADGQHLASEANKLLETAIKKKADIVIGSRFKKNLGYKSPFFRRFGTRLFESLIKIFTGKHIADPLTGFQCLSRRVIEYYAEAGVYPEYPDASLIIEMLMKKYKIVEVPVKMEVRKDGASMHDGVIQPIKYMLTQIYTCFIIFIKYVGKKYE